MKNLLIIFAIIIAAGAIAAVSLMNTPATAPLGNKNLAVPISSTDQERSTFRNVRYNYEVSYPATWIADSSEPHRVILWNAKNFQDYMVLDGTGFEPWIYNIAISVDEDVAPETTLDNYQERLYWYKFRAEIVSTVLTVANKEAAQDRIIGHGEFPPVVTYIRAGNKIYTLTLGYGGVIPDEADRMKATTIYESILDSFKFTDSR